MLRFQALLPDNQEQFSARLDETDYKLIKLCNSLNPKTIYKRYGKQDEGLQQFLKNLDKHPLKDNIFTANQRTLLEAFALLKSKPFYRMSKDGYPAFKMIEITDALASVVFHFKRDPQVGSQYSISVVLDGKKIDLMHAGTGIVTYQPAWVIHNNTLFSFEQHVDGKKLLPFTKKQTLTIPKASEHDYYRKFLNKLIEEYPVEAEGFEIIDYIQKPTFALKVTRDNQLIYTLKLVAKYGDNEVSLDRITSGIVTFVENNNNFVFYRIKRDTELEQKSWNLFQKLRNEQNRLFEYSLIEDAALQWLNEHYATLRLAGIDIIQDWEGQKLNFERPYVSARVTPHDGYWEIYATLHSNGVSIPFEQLRTSVIKSKPQLEIGDGTAIILPVEWMESFRHLFEVTKVSENGSLVLRKVHAHLLRRLLPADTMGAEAFPNPEQAFTVPDVPTGLQATLRDYQLEGYHWLTKLRQEGHGGILADDMGLGKTLQTLTLLLHCKEQGINVPSLIVMPNSLLFNWQAEAKRFTPALRTAIYHGPKRQQLLTKLSYVDIILTTYGAIRQDAELLAKHHFHYIILDESQIIKNSDSKTTQAVWQLKGDFRLSLTGTPIENSTLDIWTQMQFLNPGLLGSMYFFEQAYVLPIDKLSDARRAERLRTLVQPFILRRTKEMVATELPPRVEQFIYSEMTSSQQRLYNQTRSLYKETLFKDAGIDSLAKNRMQILSSLQRLRQIAIHPQMIDPKVHESGKYNDMMLLLNEVLSSGAKVIIFSQFVKLLSIIKMDFNKRGIKFSYIDGAVKNRQDEVVRFQEDSSIQVFLISLKAGGVGLNLTAAEYVFILDPWWNPAVELQAINRAHRIGQDKTVFVYRFITKNSIEDHIVSLQKNKARIAEEVIRTESAFIKALGQEELMALFA